MTTVEAGREDVVDVRRNGDDSSSSIRRATALLSAATLAASAANYVLNLVLARWMTPTEFGDANLIVTLMLGLTAAAVALQLIAARGVSTARVAIATFRMATLRRAWTIGSLVAITLAVTSPLLRDLTSSASAIPFAVLAIGLPCYLAQAVERGVLQGQLRFAPLALTYVIEALARLGVAIVLVVLGFGVTGATVGITVSFVASWWWGRRAASIDLVATDELVGEATSDSVGADHDRQAATQATMLLLVGQIIINNGDVVLAKALFDAAEAGVYAVVALIGRAIFFLSWSVVSAAFPHAANSDDSVARAAIRRQAMRTVTAVCVAVTVPIALVGPAVVPVLFGAEYASAGSLLLPYALATSFFALANVVATLGVASGTRRPAVIVLLGAAGQTGLLLAIASTPTQMVWGQVVAMAILLGGCVVGKTD